MADSRLSNRVFRIAGSPWTVCVLTIGVRIMVFLQLLPVQGTQGFYKYDEQARIAWAIVSGHGFSSPWLNTPLLPTAQQPPLYPWLLAGIFKLGGAYSYASLWIIEICNVLFATLTAILILKTGKQIFGPAVGVLSALIWAFWLDEAVVCLRVWESSLSALLLMLSVWIILRPKKNPGVIYWVILGAVAGTAGLTNTSLLAVFAGFWLWMFLADKERSDTRKIVLSLLVCLIVLFPWTVRNYVTFHRVLPIRDNFGFELWQGNHIEDHDGVDFSQLGEIGFMEARRAAAVQFILDNPWSFFRNCVIRFFRFWSSPDPWVWLPLSVLSWIGSIFALRNRKSDVMFLVIPILAFPLVYYITHPGTYRHPIEPAMILLAVSGAITLVVE